MMEVLGSSPEKRTNKTQTKILHMKNPKIELKKVKTFRGHDGVGLDCDLHVDGKKVCHVFDSAHGGENEYHEYGNTPEEVKSNRQILLDLNEYAKTLPPNKFPDDLGGKEYPQDLGDIINTLLMDIEIKKKFNTHIVVGVPGGDSVREISYGKPVIKLKLFQVSDLQFRVNTIKTQLKEGEQILNTNLQSLGITV